MTILKNDKENLEDSTYRYIINMILEGNFKPGDSILETSLAETLKISRTPVRQALSILVTQGFLEKKKKKGCVIPMPHPDDAKQVFLAREFLEGQVASLAALNATKSDILKLKQILENESKYFRLQAKDDYNLMNEKFHFTLMKSAANVYFERYCQHIFWRSHFYIFYFDSFYAGNKRDKKMSKPLKPFQHRQILQAIEKRDSKVAEKRMREHVKQSFKVLLNL